MGVRCFHTSHSVARCYTVPPYRFWYHRLGDGRHGPYLFSEVPGQCPLNTNNIDIMHHYTEAKNWSSPKLSEFWYHHRFPRAVPSFYKPSRTSSGDVIDSQMQLICSTRIVYRQPLIKWLRFEWGLGYLAPFGKAVWGDARSDFEALNSFLLSSYEAKTPIVPLAVPGRHTTCNILPSNLPDADDHTEHVRSFVGTSASK